MEGKHILIVEDDTMLSDSLGTHLTDAGAVVEKTGTAEEALALLEATPVDLIISDLTLPTMDGLTLAKKVAEGKRIPFIILTNNDDEENLARAMASGVTTYLLKADHSLASIVEVAREKLKATA